MSRKHSHGGAPPWTKKGIRRGRKKVKGPGSLIFLVLNICILFCAVSGAVADDGDKQVIDRVIAVVEDRAILQSDLEMEYSRFLMQLKKTNLSPAEEKENRKEILDGLIAHLLMAVHAEKIGIEVTEERIDGEIERIVDDNVRALGGIDAFQRELTKAGITLQQLKAQWREKIKSNRLIEMLKYREGLMDVNVTEDEIRDYYRNHYEELQKRPATVSLSQIQILMKAKKAAEDAAMEKIKKVEKILEEGADFEKTAREYSEGPSAKFGGSLGFVKLEDLDSPQFEKAVRQLTAGRISGPVRTEHGLHIIKLEEVSGDRVRLRHILVQVEADTEATRKTAERIRQEILDGADFAQMAVKYSEDWDTKDSGGDVGEIAVNNLPEFFVEAIRGLAGGDIAELIEEEKGFRIIKVTSWAQERPYTLEEAREGIRELIRQKNFVDNFDGYVENLKNKYYIDIKMEK